MGNRQGNYIALGTDVESTIRALEYSVVCGIDIKNSTIHSLHSPNTTLRWGYLLSPPPTSITPGEKGHLIGHKCRGTATGTSGVVSYLIGNTGWRMCVMWSAPFNFDFFDNILAVGFQTSHKEGIYESMHDSSEFSREHYATSCNTVQNTHGNFTIVGIMGTAHKSKVEIELHDRNDP